MHFSSHPVVTTLSPARASRRRDRPTPQCPPFRALADETNQPVRAHAPDGLPSAGRRAYPQSVAMYIDSRVWRPGPGDGDSEEPPRREFDIPWRGIGWTLVVVWLFIASLVTTSG